MRRLLEGLARFQTEVFPAERELFARLATEQNPEVLFITCSDSRIVPELITQAKPGDLFVCRNAGNLVPAHGEANAVSAAIEYAVLALRVKDVIVCGHSDCGAMKGLLSPGNVAAMPSVAAWLRHAERARVVVEENHPELSGRALLEAVVEQNVVAQLDSLRTHPCVAARVLKRKLALHGWVYDIESGTVREWQPASHSFTPLGKEAPGTAAAGGLEARHA